MVVPTLTCPSTTARRGGSVGPGTGWIGGYGSSLGAFALWVCYLYAEYCFSNLSKLMNHRIHNQTPSRLSSLHHGVTGFCNTTGPRIATPHFCRIKAAIITVQVAFRKDGNVWDVAVQGSSHFCYGRRHLLCKIFGLTCKAKTASNTRF